MTSERRKGGSEVYYKKTLSRHLPGFLCGTIHLLQSHPQATTYLLPLFQMIEVRWGFGVDYSSRHYIGWLLWIYTGERYYLNTFLCGLVDAKYLSYINAVCPHFSQMKWGSQGAAGNSTGVGVGLRLCHTCECWEVGFLSSAICTNCPTYTIDSNF